MSRTSPLGLLRTATRALALVTVVLVIGFGMSLHAHGIVVDHAVTHTDVLVDEGHDGSHQDVGVHPPSATHCGSGTVCVVALPLALMVLPAPETGLARFAIVDFPAAPSPISGSCGLPVVDNIAPRGRPLSVPVA